MLLEISNALAAMDRDALSRAAHKLKGASANIRAHGVHEVAFEIEREATAASAVRLKELSEGLSQEFRRAAQFLAQNLAVHRVAASAG